MVPMWRPPTLSHAPHKERRRYAQKLSEAGDYRTVAARQGDDPLAQLVWVDMDCTAQAPTTAAVVQTECRLLLARLRELVETGRSV